MSGFLTALQFLTVIPVKIKAVNEKKLGESLVYFPFVGLLLGLILTGLSGVLSSFGFSDLIISIILVVVLILLTGGLHLDGLADTFDAFCSGKGKDEMLRIMRDPHIGTMGLLAIICVILLKISFLASLELFLKPTALILMCVLSRWLMVLAFFFFPYARENGKAGAFTKNINTKVFVLATLPAVILSILAWHFKGLILCILTAGLVYLFCKMACRKIFGITGDILGAVNELSEVMILILIIILSGGINA